MTDGNSVVYTRLRSPNDHHLSNVFSVKSCENHCDRRSFFVLIFIFVMFLCSLLLIYMTFPRLQSDEYGYVKLPTDLYDAKMLGQVLSRYSDQHYYQVLLAFFVIFILLQTFAIPGTIFFSIVAGFLYPFQLALPLVCLCSGIGASCCYLLSYTFGRAIVIRFVPDRVEKLQQYIERNRDHIIYCLLFLRVTPFLPNWSINIVSPIVDVPLPVFFWATFLGVGPQSALMIQAGQSLFAMTSVQVFSWSSCALMSFFALLSLSPIFFKTWLRRKFE